MGGGREVVEDVRGFLEISKAQRWFSINTESPRGPTKSKNLICQKYQDSTTFLVPGQMAHTFSKICVISLGFACDFAFCPNDGSSKIIP